MTGCNNKKEEPVITPQDEIVDLVPYMDLVASHVRPIQQITLYANPRGEEIVKVGWLSPEITFDISDENPTSILFQIKNTPYYVDAREIEKCDRKIDSFSHLVPFNEMAQTEEAFDLLNLNGEVITHFDANYAFEVFVKEDDRIGVKFLSQMYFLLNDQVREVLPSQNSDEQLATEVPVMMYHFFYDESLGEKRKDVNFVEVKELQEQMDTLQEKQYVSLTMKELKLFLDGKANVPKKSFVITIDDGDPSVYKYAYPIIADAGYNATLFLITGWLDPMLPWEFIEMRQSGLELQSHSFLMHQGGCQGMGHGGRLLCTDHETGVQDTIQSLEYVDGGFVYCYPFGDVNDSAIQILKDAKVQLAFTTQYGKVKPGMDQYQLPRIRVTGGAGLEKYINALN